MSDGERLYQLLPAIYRIRDSAEGEPLRALMAVIEAELETLEADIEGLYENAFIETCDEWVVPYIGDLLGVRPLHDVAGAFSLRAYVANTLRYRRRKGTAAVLEQLTRDVTGWPARAVEFFQWLGTSQHLNHVRPHNLRSPDLRNTAELALIGTAFDTASYTAEARRIETHRGRYNIPNLGLFVWRLQAYAVDRGSARAIVEPPDGRYTCNPLGRDTLLFNRPQTETEISHSAEDINVPGMLRRRALYDDLEAYRRALVRGETPHSRYFAAQPVLQVFIDEQFDDDGEPVAVPPEEILICDLGDWQRPPASKTYITQTGESVELPIRVAVDPELGRLAFPFGEEPQTLQASFAYGFSADLGGGPYDRRDSLAQTLDRAVTWQVGVAQSPELQPVGGETLFASLAEAVQAWNQQPAGTVGVIAVLDSYSYREELTGADAIEIPEGSRLLLVAADWPKTDLPDNSGGQERRIGQLDPSGLRPHLRGTVSVRGTAPGESATAGELILNGLLIEGELRVLAGNLGGLRLDHCTLVPGLNGLSVNGSVNPGSQNDRLRVSVARSILAAISLPDSVPALHIEDSILDRPGELAVDAPGAAVRIDTSTLPGGVKVRELQASETIFTAPVVAERRQSGCMRFSYLAEDSRTPRRYRCQPDLALEGVTDPAEQAGIRARLVPSFTATDYGEPGYLQLGAFGPEGIAIGAEDGTEMGAFNHLKQPQRIANLRAATDDYLPFGLAAGVFFVT